MGDPTPLLTTEEPPSPPGTLWQLPTPPAWGFFGGRVSTCVTPPQGKELPTLKDVDFLNKNEKVYVAEEDQRDFLEKLKRDVEVGEAGAAPPRPSVTPPGHQ